MNRDEARATIADCLAGIAPEIDLAEVDPAARLRDQVDLDSLDFLTLVQALHARTGVTIDEEDYDAVASLDDLADYLVTRAGTASSA